MFCNLAAGGLRERGWPSMIDQRYFKYIKTIAQYHSFSKAAQVLYISQPALSRFVKKVEEELGTSLFDRDTIPLGLTPAGERYLNYMEQFQKLEGNMYAEFAAHGAGVQSLTIAALPFLGIYVLPRIIPDFAEQYPTVDQQIVECSSQEILKRLEGGEADLALTNLQPKQERFTAQRLLRDPLVLAAPYDEEMRRRYPGCANNLNSPLTMDLSQLEQKTLIVLHSWQNMRAAAEIACQHYGFTPARVVEAPSLPSALSLVCSGRGITFICPSYVHCIQPQNTLIYFALEELEGLTDIRAVYRSDTKNRWVQEFCRCATRKLEDDALGGLES